MKQHEEHTSLSTWAVVAIAAIAFFVLLGKSGWEKQRKSRVLGVTQLLADKGSDDSGSRSGGGEDHGGSSGGGSSSGGSSGSSGNVSQQVISSPTPLPSPTPKPEVNEVKEVKSATEEHKKEPKEVEVKTEKDVEEVNDALEKEDIEIGTTSGGLTVKSGDTEAETHFPLSVDVANKTLTVTTPAGVKPVTILPDTAVENILANNILNRVEAAEASQGATKKIELTQLQDQPAFAIKGFDDKRFLGFIPVSVKKTAFVSAQNGQVLTVDEDFFNKLLDALSF